MNQVQGKGGYKNLDILRLESEIGLMDWLKPHIFEQVTSTNDLALERLDQVQIGSGIVVIANEQTQGRGRLDRKWSTPAGSGIAMTLGLKASEFSGEISAVPLICGLAVNRALAKFSIAAALKWPNDIVFTKADSPNSQLKKVGGVLIQLVQDNLIIGIGLNVDLAKDDLPVANATSLFVEGYSVDRIDLIRKVLEEINFSRFDNSNWLTEYKNSCVTIGKNVEVKNFSGETVTGQAVDVLSNGALVIKNLENIYQITVGDVEHLITN